MKAAAWGVLALCLLPAGVLAALSVGDAGYREILAQERQAELLWRSVRVSAGAALLALAWGGAVAWGVHRTRGFAAAALESLSLLPLLLPPIAIVMGWIFFFGANGPAPGRVNLFTETGTAFVLSMCYFPCVSILLLQGVRSIDPMLGAVARMHAGPWRTARHVWGPLLAPYAATGALLVFLLSLGDYGVPSALRVNVYPVEIFTQMSAYYDVPRSVAFCVPPMALAVALVALRQALVRPPVETAGVSLRPVERRTSRWAVACGAAVVIAAVGVPLTATVRTLGSLATVSEALSVAGEQAINSVVLSAVSTVVLLAAGAAVAGARGGRMFGPLVVLPLVIPGAIVGLAIVVMYARGWMPRAVYDGPVAVVYALVCRTITFPALILAASLASLRGRLREAAEVSGVGPVKAALRVTLPLMAPGIVAAAVTSFLFCLGELSASALLNPPGWTTLPVRIASLLHFGEDRMVAALCLTLALVGGGVFLLGLLVLNRRLDVRLHADRA